MLGDNYPEVSHISACLISRDNDYMIVLSYIFMNVGIASSLNDRDSVKKDCLVPTIKDACFINSRFLSCNITHHMCKCHLALLTSPCGNWGLGHQCKRRLIL